MNENILIGNNRSLISTIPDNSIQTEIDSPPYYGLRDYNSNNKISNIIIFDENLSCNHEWIKDLPLKDKYYAENEPTDYDNKYQIYYFCKNCGSWKGVLGHEPNYQDRQIFIENHSITVKGYISHLAEIYGLLLPKIKPEGSLFIIVGDCFASQQKGNAPNGSAKIFKPIQLQLKEQDGEQLMIPFHLAYAIKQKGWFLRQMRLWRKPNPMTSSGKRKWIMDYELVLWFVKDIKNYYFNTQYEPKKNPNIHSKNAPNKHELYGNPTMNGFSYDAKQKSHKIARACDLVLENEIMPEFFGWEEIPPRGISQAHCAVFPPRLLFPLICATSKPNELVSDIFFGSGTMGLVAQVMKRSIFGIEYNPEYLEIYKQRKELELEKIARQYQKYRQTAIPPKYRSLNEYNFF